MQDQVVFKRKCSLVNYENTCFYPNPFISLMSTSSTTVIKKVNEKYFSHDEIKLL